MFDQVRTRYFLTPTPAELEEIEKQLKIKLEELLNKPYSSHEQLKNELKLLKKTSPRKFHDIIYLLTMLLRNLRPSLKPKSPPIEEHRAILGGI